MAEKIMFTDEQLSLLQLKFVEAFPGQIPDIRLFNTKSSTSDIIQSTEEKIKVLEFELKKQQFILKFVNDLFKKIEVTPKKIGPPVLARTTSQKSNFKPHILENHRSQSESYKAKEPRAPSLAALRGRQSSILSERIYDEPVAVISPPPQLTPATPSSAGPTTCASGDASDLSTLRSNASAGSQDTGHEDTSSDEDEPLYYNVLLMKQQSELQNSNTTTEGFSHVLQDQSLVIREDDEIDDYLSKDAANPILKLTSEALGDSYDWRDHNNSKESLELDLPVNSPELQTLDRNSLVGLSKEALEDQKRYRIVSNMLEQEMDYTTTLNVMRQLKLLFENHKKGSEPFINIEESQVIFSNIPKLFDMQKQFTDGLAEKVKYWRQDDCIGELFYDLVKEECVLAGEYMKNYHQAVNMYKKCSEQNKKFWEVTRSMPTPALRNCTMEARQFKIPREPSKDNSDITSLEELLYMPVVRTQRHSLTIHELIKVTSAKHVDYDVLQKTLKLTQDFLENFSEKKEDNNSGTLRYLAKQGLTVQQVRNRRTLRHLFLFRDIIICAKQRISGRQKVHYDLKWSIPLCDAVISNNISVQDEPTIEDERHNQIMQTECRVSQLQNELKLSIKRMHADQSNKQITARSIPKHIEKLQKKLAEQEATLLKIAPNLIFTLFNKNSSKTTYTLLMSSDYERSSWKDMIIGLQSRVIALNERISMTPTEQQFLINSQKKQPTSRLALERKDLGIVQESLFGLLNITIFSINGLESNSDTFCVIETDSFGHYTVKAKTSIARNKSSPVWNEGFEIDMDGTQTLRILSYKLVDNHDVLLGKCALELSRDWLSGECIQKKITLNEKVQITISLKYTSKDYMKRTPSTAKGVVFGAKLRDVVQREGKFVPIIVSSCIEEVEARGINEVGIYRVSGLTGQVQYLKKAFDKNSRLGATMLKENEINAVTSLLKQYFRELPEALFTDALYPRLMEEYVIGDTALREKRMIALVKTLPQSNLSVIQYIFKHIISISQEPSNKMNLSNLATVFGPTLLKPAMKSLPTLPINSGSNGGKYQNQEAESAITMEMFNEQARDAINQTGVLLLLLTLSKKGIDFSRIH